MSDTVLIHNQPLFGVQSRTHKAVSEHISRVITTHQPLHDNFIVAANKLIPEPPHIVTNMPDLGATYTNWWASHESSLENAANVHNDAGTQLLGVVGGFNTLDTSTAGGFSSAA